MDTPLEYYNYVFSMDEDEDPAARKRRKANERQKRWLEKQDPESRERIRAAKAAASRLRIAAETPEQRQARQDVDALAHQIRIAAEIPEQRSARQAVDAMAHQIRITNFLKHAPVSHRAKKGAAPRPASQTILCKKKRKIFSSSGFEPPTFRTPARRSIHYTTAAVHNENVLAVERM